MTAADIKEWGGIVLGGIGTAIAIWNKFGLRFLHAQWDGFKLDYDKLNRSDADKGGRLAEQKDVRDRAEQKKGK